MPAIALILLPCLAFGLALGNEFVSWDDPLLITENLKAQSLSWIHIKEAFTTFDPELYIPLTLLSYHITGSLFGLSPAAFHLGNLLLHIGGVLLLWQIVKRVLRSDRAAWVAAALFAIHPLNTEAVVWAAARKDLLSATFALGSLLLWLQWHEKAKKSSFMGSVLLFIFGLLSKVSILTFPLLWPLLIVARDGRTKKTDWISIVPHLLGSAVFLAVAMTGKITTGPFLWVEIMIGIIAIPFLFLKLLLPVHLAVLYPYAKNIAFFSPDVLLSLGVILGISAAVWLLRNRSRWPLLGWVWFIVLLLPGFGNVVKGQNELFDLYLTSDRYAYLAAIGPFLAAGLFFVRMKKRYETASVTLGMAAIALLTILSIRQTLTWKTSDALWRHTAAAQPRSYLAHSNLGVVLAKRGDREGAATAFGSALAIRPDGMTYTNLGILLEEVGKPDLALRAYRKAVEASSMQKDAYIRIAVLESRLGKPKEAMEALEKAKELDPTNPEIEKAIVWLNEGKTLP